MHDTPSGSHYGAVRITDIRKKPIEIKTKIRGEYKHLNLTYHDLAIRHHTTVAVIEYILKD